MSKGMPPQVAQVFEWAEAVGFGGGFAWTLDDLRERHRGRVEHAWAEAHLIEEEAVLRRALHALRRPMSWWKVEDLYVPEVFGNEISAAEWLNEWLAEWRAATAEQTRYAARLAGRWVAQAMLNRCLEEFALVKVAMRGVEGADGLEWEKMFRAGVSS